VATASQTSTLLSVREVSMGDVQQPYLVRRQNGNPDASGDLYGLGLRIGAYLQIAGMLLCCIRSERRTRAGIKLISSAICLSLLCSCTILVRQQNLSPCEAWLVLSLTNAYTTPRAAAINNTGTSAGGVALIFAAASIIWQGVLSMWLFATLVVNLPSLGTRNRVWLFVELDILGWFRILMLVYFSVCCLLLPFQLVCFLLAVERRFNNWTKGLVGEPGMDERSEDEQHTAHRWISRKWSQIMSQIAVGLEVLIAKNIAFQKIDVLNDTWFDTLFRVRRLSRFEQQDRKLLGEKTLRIGRCVWGFFILTLTIVGVEKIITYNNLSVQQDISKPGQIIPLVLGVITFMEGAASALMPEPLPEPRRGSTVVAQANEGQIPLHNFGIVKRHSRGSE